jgi:hypothetical protein
MFIDKAKFWKEYGIEGNFIHELALVVQLHEHEIVEVEGVLDGEGRAGPAPTVSIIIAVVLVVLIAVLSVSK